MAQFYRYGNEPERQVFSSYTENECLSNGMASGQSYPNPVVAETYQTQYYGHTTNPPYGHNHNLGKLPVAGYQQVTYPNYGMGTSTNLTQSCVPAPPTGYYGKHHESHVKRAFRKQKYRDGCGSVEYTSCSESESDDEGHGRRRGL